jgi:Ca-activated chloride channel family protein
VLPTIDLASVRFEAPQYLWLLVAPALLLVIWLWRLSRYRQSAHRFRARRKLPVRERLSLFGGLPFWLFAILATASTIVALARPVAMVSLVRTAGVDLVLLQDGSASMRTPDVTGDRWQRSIRFLRTVGESLRWTNDRVAMALFAHIAAPEVRLTNDPNTFFFFLDHLDRESPFPQDDDTTWDTNIALGIYWGVRLIEKDEELNHRSPNAKVFLLVSDGQTWSGEVQKSIKLAHDRGIPIFVVGVGTTAGGIIPEPPPKVVVVGRNPPPPAKPIRSALDRASLGTIATAGGGEYFELGREPDRDIANHIIEAARKRSGTLGVQATAQSLYWRCLVAAACFLGLGILTVRDHAELWLHALGAGGALATLWLLTH